MQKFVQRIIHFTNTPPTNILYNPQDTIQGTRKLQARIHPIGATLEPSPSSKMRKMTEMSLSGSHQRANNPNPRIIVPFPEFRNVKRTFMEMVMALLDLVCILMDQRTPTTPVVMILIQTPAITLIAINIIDVLTIVVVTVLVAMNPRP